MLVLLTFPDYLIVIKYILNILARRRGVSEKQESQREDEAWFSQILNKNYSREASLFHEIH